MHCGYIVKVEKLRPHGNADRLQIATFFGNDTCVGLDIVLGEIGIYFPTDLQLSVEYCDKNNLVRKKDENGNNIGGYMDPDKRNVTAVRLRGERSDGLYMPLSSLAFTGVNMDDLNIGDTIDIVNGVEICRKYIPRGNKRRSGGQSEGNRTRKKKVPVAPLFAEHADTEQLAYNLAAFKPGDQIEITLKLHGTSTRTGYLPVLKGYKRNFLDILLRRDGKPKYEWDYVSGTRRTILENYDNGYYGSNQFRKQHTEIFTGKLHKGEEIFGEIVGYTDQEAPIMGVGNCEKVDKDFVKQYGKSMIFSYGCEPTGKKIMYGQDEEGIFSIEQEVPQSDLYIYRMTLTTEEGHVIEYTPDYMRYRCEQMGIKTVPVFEKFYIPNEDELNTMGISAGEYVKEIVNKYLNTEPDPIGKTHIKEGVVVRIINRPKFTAYKDKVFEFKVIEGIIKSAASAPDMEEAEEVLDKDN